MKEYIVREPKHIVVGIEEYKTCFGEPIYELIRCKDCIHHHGYYCDRLYGFQDAFTLQDEDYCSRAERKETS